MASPPKIPTDPLLTQLQQQAKADETQALELQARGDTASLMARYGTRLALGGAGITSAATGSPLIARAPAIGTLGRSA